jgi:hypothetical protein
MKVEYIATSEVAKEVVWIKKIISELGVVPSASSPTDIYCDNSGAIAQAKEPRAQKRVNTFTTVLPSHPRHHWSR